jgi:hypothetical protein
MMERRFCGIDLVAVLDRLAGRRPEQQVARAVLTELVTEGVPFHAVHDDLMPADYYCLLFLGRHAGGFYFVKLEGPQPSGSEREMEIGLIRHAAGALPSGGRVDAQKTAKALLAAPHKTAVALLIGETRAAGINYGFGHNPILAKPVAGRFLRKYVKKHLDERTAQN